MLLHIWKKSLLTRMSNGLILRNCALLAYRGTTMPSPCAVCVHVFVLIEDASYIFRLKALMTQCVAHQHSCVDILWPIHFLRELLFLHWNTDFRSVMHFAVADDIIQCCSLIYLKPSEKCPHITMTRVSPVLLASYSSFDGFAAASAAVAASKLPPASVDGRSFSRCVRLVCS